MKNWIEYQDFQYKLLLLWLLLLLMLCIFIINKYYKHNVLENQFWKCTCITQTFIVIQQIIIQMQQIGYQMKGKLLCFQTNQKLINLDELLQN